MKNVHILLICAMAFVLILFVFYPLSNASESDIHPYDLQFNFINGVPDVRQPTDYSCGPTSLQAVLSYYGIDKKLDDLINVTHSSPEGGTAPENIALAARGYGLNAEVKEGLTLENLQGYIQQKIPVIIDCQAWAEQHDDINWTQDIEDGHYMVVVGMNKDNIYFEDPAILGSLGYMSRQEFINRWHDEYIDPGTGQIKKTYHMGIIISGKPPVISQGLIKVD